MTHPQNPVIMKKIAQSTLLSVVLFEFSKLIQLDMTIIAIKTRNATKPITAAMFEFVVVKTRSVMMNIDNNDKSALSMVSSLVNLIIIRISCNKRL